METGSLFKCTYTNCLLVRPKLKPSNCTKFHNPTTKQLLNYSHERVSAYINLVNVFFCSYFIQFERYFTQLPFERYVFHQKPHVKSCA